ncbi:MAG: type IX secretion system outer membrane channel protein PorV [Cytophagales bacterium]|nr:type IX secretion system outer membrane channel protein PorV [Cytophagales bacterium]
MRSFFKIMVLTLIPGFALAQGPQVRINELGGQSNPITVAVPFISFAPDSRGAAMGDAGVATSPDAYSVHWNNAKLAFIDYDMGFSFSYSPWLGNIVDDMSLNYLTFYKKINRDQTFGASLRYFDLGEIQLTDLNGDPLGIENPREAAIDVTYARKLSENLSLGATGRFIWSNLSGNITNAPDVRPGTSLAVDVGLYYTQPLSLPGIESDLSLGAHISNIGQKITYTSESNEDFIPANLRLGAAWTGKLDPYNSITFAFDVNKLMVPTPPTYVTNDDGEFERNPDGSLRILEGEDPNRPLISGTFGSFSDAPGGFNEELKEFSLSFGAEYQYQELFFARVGYFSEHVDKGDRKYFTAGLGFRYQVFGLDFSYLIPQEQNHPLGDTLRLSFIFSFNKEEDQ